jgi:RNA polymerase-binding transcription factor DksA
MSDGQAREILEVERAQTVKRLGALVDEFNSIVAASMDANSDDEHDPEGATIAFERERTAALRAQAVAHLIDLDQALARVTSGTYGTCIICGHAIDAERLRALPITESCTACAGRPRSPLMSRP